jgi:Uma2 family endonuclease
MSAVLDKVVPKTMTADEFERSPFAESYELIRGELYQIVPAGTLRGVVTSRISRFLSSFEYDNNLGEVMAAETGFRLSDRSLVGADIAFVGKENLARFGVPDSFFPSAPDLAVEVVSASNTSDEITTKVEDYLARSVFCTRQMNWMERTSFPDFAARWRRSSAICLR